MNLRPDPMTECPACWGRNDGGERCQLCAGSGQVRDHLVSPHFRFSEMVGTAHRRFPNMPGPAEMGNLQRLCMELLEPVRELVGPLRVNSAYRTPELDAFVARDDSWLTRKSAHAIGAAADCVPTGWGVPLRAVVDAVLRLRIPFDQAILEGGCCHLALLAPVGGVQRRQALVRVRPQAWLAWLDGGRIGAEPTPWAYEGFTGSLDQTLRVA